MSKNVKSRKKPNIVLSQHDYDRLSQIAEAAEDRLAEIADELMAELDRAKVIANGSVPANVVRMGSHVEFETDAGQRRSVILVYPAEADIAANKISVMTPIGIALIGLSPKQQMSWTDRDGQKREFTVLAVEPPAA